MRRKDRERDAAFAWQVMTAAPYATLSLVDESGKPYAVPVSQGAWEQGGCIYFHCALAGKKYELFKNGCAAAMSAVSHAEIIPNEAADSAMTGCKCENCRRGQANWESRPHRRLS